MIIDEDRIKAGLLSPSIHSRANACKYLEALAEDEYQNPLETSFKTRQLIISILASDPIFEFRDLAANTAFDLLQSLTPQDAFDEFCSLVRSQKLQGIRTGDPRLSKEDPYNICISRENQLSTILRVLQLLAMMPACDKHSKSFFDLIKFSGFIENLYPQNFQDEDYRDFIRRDFRIENRPLETRSDLPAAFVRLCASAIRKAEIIEAYFLNDFSKVGNINLAEVYPDSDTFMKAIRGLSVRGCVYTLFTILERFKLDPEFSDAYYKISHLKDFFAHNTKHNLQ